MNYLWKNVKVWATAEYLRRCHSQPNFCFSCVWQQETGDVRLKAVMWMPVCCSAANNADISVKWGGVQLMKQTMTYFTRIIIRILHSLYTTRSNVHIHTHTHCCCTGYHKPIVWFVIIDLQTLMDVYVTIFNWESLHLRKSRHRQTVTLSELHVLLSLVLLLQFSFSYLEVSTTYAGYRLAASYQKVVLLASHIDLQISL